MDGKKCVGDGQMNRRMDGGWTDRMNKLWFDGTTKNMQMSKWMN